MDLGPRELQDRGLAGPVRPEDDPALVVGDLPVEAVDDRAAPAQDGHLAEAEHLDHAPTLPAHNGRAGPRRALPSFRWVLRR